MFTGEVTYIYRGEREAQRAWSAKRLYSNLGDKLGDYSCRVINSNTPPRSRNGGGANVQTGAKVCEDRRREAFGEDVSELQCGGNMKNTDSTDGNTFPDKMEINFHMLGALMLNRVGGEVDGTDIVTIDDGGSL
jgi:hypothetical protein